MFFISYLYYLRSYLWYKNKTRLRFELYLCIAILTPFLLLILETPIEDKTLTSDQANSEDYLQQKGKQFNFII